MGIAPWQIKVAHQCGKAQIDIRIGLLLVGQHLFEFVIVIKRRDFNGTLWQPKPQNRPDRAVEHRDIKFQIIADQGAGADKAHQLLHRVLNRNAVSQIAVPQAVNSGTFRRYSLFRFDQQFQPFARHDFVADNPHGSHRNDFVILDVQAGCFAIKRHILVLRWRIIHETEFGLGEMVKQPFAFQHPRPMKRRKRIGHQRASSLKR